LTAHAMKGDRERCLEAGADEYVTKPIRMSELFAAMKRVKAGKSSPDAVAPPSVAAVPSHDLDMAAALERVDGDRALFEELARLFADESSDNIARIRQGMKTGDARAIEMLAHKIKGAASSLGSPMVSEAASDLEIQARTGQVGNADPLVENLKRQLDLLLPALELFCRQVIR
jgi:two-component system sensor histidine kinase/response regulator